MSGIREPFRLLGRDAISDLNFDVANRQMQVTTAAGTTGVLQLSEPEMASVRWAIRRQDGSTPSLTPPHLSPARD